MTIISPVTYNYNGLFKEKEIALCRPK